MRRESLACLLEYHHCGSVFPIHKSCPGMLERRHIYFLRPQGIERIAEELGQRFPDSKISVISLHLLPGA